MIDKLQLSQEGITFVVNIYSDEDMIAAACCVGDIVPSPNNEIIKILANFSREEATNNSKSKKYGLGMFPLHTDTVFWSLPARYVLLKCDGDRRRSTTYLEFSTIFDSMNEEEINFVSTGIWSVRIPGKAFYTTLSFCNSTGQGYKFDPDLMFPENYSAKKIHDKIVSSCFSDKVKKIEWKENVVVIIDNAKLMHGRSAPPDHESRRTIKRVYVR